MLSQLLNHMDEYLSNTPFQRRWWSRPWIVHMTIQPPLSKDAPLWKRSKDELRLLRLFDLSPEELGQKIERYWKKPRWRRWFSSFGMNKKIDVWNYYHRCLAYQAVRPETQEQGSVVIASKRRPLLDELGLVLHQSTVKFETYLEKRRRNPTWLGKHFLEEIEAYKRRLEKTFLTTLTKSLRRIETEAERFALKQHAEQEYQHVEVIMLRYYHHRFSDPSHANRVPKIGRDVAQEGNVANPERRLAVHRHSQTVSSSSSSTLLPREMNPQPQIGIASLHGAKGWIKTQRQRLNALIEEGTLQDVEVLLQTSLDEIKTITELHLGCCETMIFTIQGQHEIYDTFLDYLDNVQHRLKSLLQGGMLLFHPDHMVNLRHSQAMWELITRYSQSYLVQSRCYLDRFKKLHLRLEEFYQHSQKELKIQQELQGWSDLERRIQELGQSFKELKQSVEEFAKKLNEVIAQQVQDNEAMEVKLKESEAKLAQYKAESDAKMKTIMDLFESQQQVASTSSVSEANMPESSNVRFFRQ